MHETDRAQLGALLIIQIVTFALAGLSLIAENEGALSPILLEFLPVISFQFGLLTV